MIRIQPQSDDSDSLEERKKVRDAVFGNVTSFFLLIGLIRAVPYVLQQFKSVN